MEQLTALLKSSCLFRGLSDDAIQQYILPHGRVQEISGGSYLIHHLQRCDFFGIVLSGKISLMHIYENGNQSIMGILEKTDLLGADLVCTHNRISPYYAVAAKQSRIISFPASMIMEPGLIPEELRLAILHSILRYVSDENMRKEYRLAILSRKGIRDRIMTFLTMQASKRQSNTFSVPFTRDEMASYLCVNRTCLSRELSQMEDEGIIRFSKNVFTLLNWDPVNSEFDELI